MNIKELNLFEAVYQPSKEITYCWGVKKYVQLSTEENHTDIVDHANYSLRIWQAAKAQAIPDGFVVVPKEPTERMLGAARRRQWDDFSSPLEDMDILKYKAMLEAAQEKEND